MSPNSDSILSQELSRRTASRPCSAQLLQPFFLVCPLAPMLRRPPRKPPTSSMRPRLSLTRSRPSSTASQMNTRRWPTRTPRPSTISRAYRARLTARRRRLTKRRPSSKRSAAIFPIAFPPAISRAAPTSCRCCSPRVRLRNSSPMRTMLRRSTRATATPSRHSGHPGRARCAKDRA